MRVYSGGGNIHIVSFSYFCTSSGETLRRRSVVLLYVR